MKNNIMKKWVKALRSGKFKQGTGTLKQFNSKGQAQHCCLGVLCELYNSEMKKNKKKTLSEKVYDNDIGFGYTRFNGSADCLPQNVRDWSGIASSYGKFYGGDTLPEPLADLNDNGKKFKTIADIIEKNWENL
jgi:hypothetical protein